MFPLNSRTPIPPYGRGLPRGERISVGVRYPALQFGMQFDGVNDFAEVTGLGLGAPTEFTAMGFIRFTAIGRYDFFTTEAASGTNGYALALISNSFAYRTSGTLTLETNVSFNPVIGTRYHVALRVTTSNQLSFFIDGALVRSAIIAAANQPSSFTRIRFGAGFIATPAVYAAWSVYQRALSDVEIAAAARTRSLYPRFEGLVGAYPFEQIGPAAAQSPDLSGTARHLTLTNMIPNPIVAF